MLPFRLFVSREASPSIPSRAALQWQRSSIHFWHHIRQKNPLGQAPVLNYESLTVPDIQSQSIRLWSDGKYLGVVPGKDVLRNHLSPGNMLPLRGDPPSKSGHPPPSPYDYEVRPLQTDHPESMQQARPKTLRAKEFYLNASVSSERLRFQLLSPYRWLDHSSRANVKIHLF